MEIIAVEPHPDMLRVLRAKELDRVDVREGNAQAIPVEDCWADSLIVAQVFIPLSDEKTIISMLKRREAGIPLVREYRISRRICTRSATAARIAGLDLECGGLQPDQRRRCCH